METMHQVPCDDGFCWNYRLMTSCDVTTAAYTEGYTHPTPPIDHASIDMSCQPHPCPAPR